MKDQVKNLYFARKDFAILDSLIAYKLLGVVFPRVEIKGRLSETLGICISFFTVK